MTPAEKKIWNELFARRQLKNLRWLRQRPIADFIVDFYCPQMKLVLEIDGPSHDYSQNEDEVRTAILEGLGIAVVRFTNKEVETNLEGIRQELLQLIHRMTDKTPPCAPLHEGGKKSGRITCRWA